MKNRDAQNGTQSLKESYKGSPLNKGESAGDTASRDSSMWTGQGGLIPPLGVLILLSVVLLSGCGDVSSSAICQDACISEGMYSTGWWVDSDYLRCDCARPILISKADLEGGRP